MDEGSRDTKKKSLSSLFGSMFKLDAHVARLLSLGDLDVR